MHNVDERDAFAWAPGAVPPHRLRASALLAACAALSKHDTAQPAAPAATPRAAPAAGAPSSPFAAEPLHADSTAQPAAVAVTPPQSPHAASCQAPEAEEAGFSTPKGQALRLGFIDFPTPADTSALSTPTLMTPACTPPLARRLVPAEVPAATERCGAAAPAPEPAAAEEPCHMLWRKLGGRFWGESLLLKLQLACTLFRDRQYACWC